MRITILTLTYPPEPAEQIHELAKYFLSQNHDVTIITCLPSYPKGKIYKGFRFKFFQINYVDGIKIIRVLVFPSQSPNIFHRLLYYSTFALSTIIPVICTKTDIFVLYHPPPSVIVPIFIRNLFKKTKFVYWINDMWPETLEVVGLKKSFVNIINKIHSYIYSKAKGIIVLSDGFKENLIKKGVLKNKIKVIHNWVNANEFRTTKSSNYIYSKYDIDKNNFHIMYAGSQGKMQELNVLINSFKYLKNFSNIKLILLGTGTEHQKLKKLVLDEKLNSQVHMLGRVPSEDLPYLYNISDVMIIHLKPLKINNITIPHKIYGYMAAKKPIIGAISGAGANEILNSNCGYVCNPGKPNIISELILKMYNLSEEERKNLGLNGYDFIKHNRSITTQGYSFLNILK